MRLHTLLLVGALLAVGLAGCVNDDGSDEITPGIFPAGPSGHPLWIFDAEQNALTEADFPGEVPVFEQVDVTQRISGEPTIAVTRTGAVFYPSIDFDSGVPGIQALPTTVLYRSIDQGATWEDFSPHLLQVKTHPYSFDPYVYADPTTGRVYALDMGPHVACNKVSWSDDDGKTWLTRDGACPLPVADHPSIFAAPKVGPLGGLSQVTDMPTSYPNNLFLCSNQIADVQCSLSPDGGLTWLPSQPVFTGVDLADLTDDPASLEWLCGSLTGHGHASFVDGTVYIGRGYCGVPMVGISRDGGLNWETVAITTEPKYFVGYEHDVSVGTDQAGNAYALWIGDQDRSVYLSTSTDQGATWSAPINVTAPGVTAVKLPSLVAGAPGRIAFQYVGTTTPSGWSIDTDAADNETLQAERLNATWNAYVTIGVDVVNHTAVFATTTVNDLAKPLKRGGCFDRCFGDIGGMYDFFDIDIDPMTGQVWTAMTDVCTGACDEPGADADTFQRSFGAVGRQVGGMFLLDEPVPER